MYNKMLLALATALVMEATSLEAAVPTSMSYQGRLMNNNLAVNTNVTMRFALYTEATDGIKVWPSTADYEQKTVAVDKGLYTAYIGSTAGMELSPELFGQDLWLQVWVDGTALTRTKISTTPYSYFAGLANNVVDNAITTDKIANGTIKGEDLATDIGINTTGAISGTTATFSGQLQGESNIVAGTDNAPGAFEIKDGVGRTVAITAEALTENYMITLPPAAPTAPAQVLVANVDGTTRWADPVAVDIVGGSTGAIPFQDANGESTNFLGIGNVGDVLVVKDAAQPEWKKLGDANIEDAANIAQSKIANLTTDLAAKANIADVNTALAGKQSTTIGDGKILVGAETTGTATAVTISGDVTMSNTGVTAIGNEKVTNGMLAGNIADSKLSQITTADKVAQVAVVGLTDALAGKQATLTAGNGIDITTNTISAKLDEASLSKGANGLKINVENSNSWTATQTFSAATTGIVATTAIDAQGTIVNTSGTNPVTINDNLTVNGKLKLSYNSVVGTVNLSNTMANTSVINFTGATVVSASDIAGVTGAESGQLVYIINGNEYEITVLGKTVAPGTMVALVYAGTRWVVMP